MHEPYFERHGERMPPATDLEAGDIVVIPRAVEDSATDWGRYKGDMELRIAAVQRGCIVKELEPGPDGEIRRLIQAEDED